MKNNEDLQIFCKNLKFLRKQHALTQKKFAKICGVGITTMRNLERGIVPKKLGARIFINVSKAFGLSPSALLTYLLEEQEKLSKNS